MPYTQEELKNLTFYQNLIDEDEQQYLQNKASLELVINRMQMVSGELKKKILFT